MAVQRIKINEFPHLDSIVGSELLPLGRASDGNGVHVTMDEFKDWIGFEQFTGVVPQKAPSTNLVGSAGVPAIYIGDAGTYTLNGGAATEYTEPINYFFWNGTEWNVLEVPIETKIEAWTAGTYTEGDQRIHNGQIWSVDVPSTTEEPGTGADWKEIIDAASKEEVSLKAGRAEVGIDIIPSGTNLVPPLTGTDFQDEETWTAGYLNSSGGISAAENWYTTVRKYPIVEGDISSNLFLSGNARALIFDSEDNIIASVQDKSSAAILAGTERYLISAPFGSAYIRVCKSTSQTVDVTIENTEVIPQPTSRVFATPLFVSEKISADMSKFGLKTIEAGNNFIAELTDSDLDDTEIWGSGRLSATGTVMPDSAWHYSKKKYKVYKGKYRVRGYYRGTAKCLILDADDNVVQVIENNTGTDLSDREVDFLQDGFFQMSFRGIQAEVPNLLVENVETLYLSDIKVDIQVESEVRESNVANPVNGFGVTSFYKNILQDSIPSRPKFPVVSFISDDGGTYNDEWFVPLLDDKGVKATFAIITGRPNAENPDFWTMQRVREISEMGHNIASHTDSHLHTATLTPEQQEFELKTSKLKLVANGEAADLFVAPFGSRSPAMDKIVRQYYKANFVTLPDSYVTSGNCCNTSPIRSYTLNRISFDASANGVSRIDICKQAVDVALNNNEWLVFAIHPHFAEYTPSNPDYIDRRAELGVLIDYIRSLGIHILHAGAAFELWKNKVEIGNRVIDPVYYEIGMDGTEIGNYFD